MLKFIARNVSYIRNITLLRCNTVWCIITTKHHQQQLTSSCLRRRISSFCRLSASSDLICESLIRCSLRNCINSWLCFNSACRPLIVSSRILLISWTYMTHTSIFVEFTAVSARHTWCNQPRLDRLGLAATPNYEKWASFRLCLTHFTKWIKCVKNCIGCTNYSNW